MEKKDLKVGAVVEWTSTAAGSRKLKRGAIVAIVPTGAHPEDFIPTSWQGPKLKDAGRPRGHTSYLVDHAGKLYWPRVSALLTINQ